MGMCLCLLTWHSGLCLDLFAWFICLLTAWITIWIICLVINKTLPMYSQNTPWTASRLHSWLCNQDPDHSRTKWVEQWLTSSNVLRRSMAGGYPWRATTCFYCGQSRHLCATPRNHSHRESQRTKVSGVSFLSCVTLPIWLSYSMLMKFIVSQP